MLLSLQASASQILNFNTASVWGQLKGSVLERAVLVQDRE